MGNPLETCFCGDLKSQHVISFLNRIQNKQSCKFCKCHNYYDRKRPTFKEDWLALILNLGNIGFIFYFMNSFFFNYMKLLPQQNILFGLLVALVLISIVGITMTFSDLIAIQKRKKEYGKFAN